MSDKEFNEKIFKMKINRHYTLSCASSLSRLFKERKKLLVEVKQILDEFSAERKNKDDDFVTEWCLLQQAYKILNEYIGMEK